MGTNRQMSKSNRRPGRSLARLSLVWSQSGPSTPCSEEGRQMQQPFSFWTSFIHRVNKYHILNIRVLTCGFCGMFQNLSAPSLDREEATPFFWFLVSLSGGRERKQLFHNKPTSSRTRWQNTNGAQRTKTHTLFQCGAAVKGEESISIWTGAQRLLFAVFLLFLKKTSCTYIFQPLENISLFPHIPLWSLTLVLGGWLQTQIRNNHLAAEVIFNHNSFFFHSF